MHGRVRPVVGACELTTWCWFRARLHLGNDAGVGQILCIETMDAVLERHERGKDNEKGAHLSCTPVTLRCCYVNAMKSFRDTWSIRCFLSAQVGVG